MQTIAIIKGLLIAIFRRVDGGLSPELVKPASQHRYHFHNHQPPPFTHTHSIQSSQSDGNPFLLILIPRNPGIISQKKGEKGFKFFPRKGETIHRKTLDSVVETRFSDVDFLNHRPSGCWEPEVVSAEPCHQPCRMAAGTAERASFRDAPGHVGLYLANLDYWSNISQEFPRKYLGNRWKSSYVWSTISSSICKQLIVRLFTWI